MNILSKTMVLILVLNPLGNLPFFISTLKHIKEKRRNKILIRETFIAFVLLSVFMIFGEYILGGFQVSTQALGIAGGVILFIVALRMIFPDENKQGANGSHNGESQEKSEPFFVPLAVPMIAGPAAISTVMLLCNQDSNGLHGKIFLFISILIASTICCLIFLSGNYLSKLLGDKGLIAMERLMGMMLTATAIQMFLGGLNAYIRLH